MSEQTDIQGMMTDAIDQAERNEWMATLAVVLHAAEATLEAVKSKQDYDGYAFTFALSQVRSVAAALEEKAKEATQ